MKTPKKHHRNRPEEKVTREAHPKRNARAHTEGFHASPRGSYVSFYDINDDKADALAAFFRILDRWDREQSDLSEGN